MRYLFLCATFASTLLLTGCAGIVGFWMTAGGVAAVPVAGYEMTRDRSVDHNLKPYGAHWIKDGMTRESRHFDFIKCGGGVDLGDGYEVQSSQSKSTQEIFDGLNAHIFRLLECMKSKDYVYLGQCDARCLYP